MSLVLIPRAEVVDQRILLIVEEGTTLDAGQTRAFAALLNSLAESLDREAAALKEKLRIASLPPVDRTKRQLSNGEPVPTDDSHTEIEPATGMQKAYIVLSPEERAKGFCRPVQRSYRHVGMLGPNRPFRDLTEDEKVRYAEYNYVKYEEYGPERAPITGRFWTQEQIDHIGQGCGQVTTMGQAIAETFARDPHFYSGGFCATCGKHFPNEEFRWLDGSKVGE